MDALNNILLWVHLLALSLGGVATFGIPIGGRMMATVTPEQRPLIFAINRGLSSVGRTGLAVLLVTGPLLVWLKYGGPEGLNHWFWTKMLLVLLLLVAVIVSGVLSKRAAAGDQAAAARLPLLGAISMVLLVGVVLTAVFAFS